MANNSTKMFNDWLTSAQERVKSASVKMAADQEALTGIKDPTCLGTVSIPDCGDGSNRSAQGLPTNKSNMGEPDKEHNIMDVTKPNGVGQGTYVTPANGTAADEAVKSPTAPLDKLAGAIKGMKAAAARLTPGEQQQPATFELPISLAEDASLMDKLASIGGLMLGSEEGQRAVAAVLEKEAGIAEARAIIAEAQDTMYKAAAAEQFYANNDMITEQEYVMQKIASAQASHQAWYDQFNTDMEKYAYAQGAEDGDAMADAVQEGADVDAMADVSDEEVIAYLQELVQTGQISQEEAEAVLQAIGDAGQDGLTPEEMAAAIEEAVQSGEITPEHAQALAQQYMAQFGAEEAAGEGVDPAAAAEADAATEKTAAVINHLWTPNMA
jgi:polyhydroxyalkanoate synthesis regulator phasin